MTYGWVTEELSRPEDNGDEKPMKWALRNGNPDLVIPELPAAFQRLFPHIVGYVPYSCVWAVLGHSFLSNVGDGGGPPIFVYVIVLGQFAVFTAFGITQLLNQAVENGPSWYMWGESHFSNRLFSTVYSQSFVAQVSGATSTCLCLAKASSAGRSSHRF